MQNENEQVDGPRLDETYGGYQRVPNNSVNLETSSLTPTLTPHCPNNTMTAIPEAQEAQEAQKETQEAQEKTREQVTVVRRQTSVPAPASAPANLENIGSKSPVKETLQRIRRSITEPLIQYFHDITLVSCILCIFIHRG